MGLRERIATQRQRDQRSSRPEDDDVLRYRKELLDEVDLTELSGLTPSQRRARLERVVGYLITRDGPILSDLERNALIRRIVDEALGLGVLEGLLADDSVTEIMVNGPEDVWVERYGQLERVPVRFANDEQLYQTIDRIVAGVNRRVDESSPMVDARLPGGERVNVIIPPLSLKGPILTIRRFPRAYTLQQLLEMGSLDEPLYDLLAAFVRARCNVVVSGGTGTGKTTLLNALSGFLSESERIVTIEDAAELSLQQPHVISLEVRPPSVEGKGEVTIRDLVRNSLRMRPDRIIVGEVRGPETLDMLQAMNTGHEGSLVTVHANSPDDAVTRLETLASMSELGITFEALRDQINSAVEVIVQIWRGPDGSRRITEVATVASRRRENFRLATICAFEADPLRPGRRVTGRYRYFPLTDDLARRLVLAGQRVPPAFQTTDGDVAPVREAV
jgi:pilus assembly protein CpaF